MTALPIIETMEGDISAYIPTNVISITDGQIYLESELFHSGVRPAVNVSFRSPASAAARKSKAMRKVAGKLRLDLAQYRELAVFSRFGSTWTRPPKLLAQGERVSRRTLKQEQYHTMPLAAPGGRPVRGDPQAPDRHPRFQGDGLQQGARGFRGHAVS